MPKPALTPPSILLSLLLFPSAHAQVVDISGCRAIEDSVERFRCYEELDRAGLGSEAGPPPLPQESPVAESTSESSEKSPLTLQDFGIQEDRRARLKEDEEGQVELHDTVTGLERLLPHVWDVTLASGQVWRQVDSRPYNLREGDEVRIYPSRWGRNYRLSAQRLEGFIQVRRLR